MRKVCIRHKCPRKVYFNCFIISLVVVRKLRIWAVTPAAMRISRSLNHKALTTIIAE